MSREAEVTVTPWDLATYRERYDDLIPRMRVASEAAIENLERAQRAEVERDVLRSTLEEAVALLERYNESFYDYEVVTFLAAWRTPETTE